MKTKISWIIPIICTYIGLMVQITSAEKQTKLTVFEKVEEIDIKRIVERIIIKESRTMSISGRCGKKIIDIVNHFTRETETLLNLVLYSGKGVNELGNYEKCRASGDTTHYLILQIKFEGMILFIGMCIPIECNPSDLDFLIPSIYKLILPMMKGLHPNDISFLNPREKLDELQDSKVGLIISLCYVGGIAICTVIATLIHIIYIYKGGVNANVNANGNENGNANGNGNENANANGNTKTPLFVTSFSFIPNFQELTTGKNEVGDTRLNIFYGVKVLSMCWIILGNTFYVLLFATIFDPQSLLDDAKSFTMCLVVNVILSYDVFFFVSGFLNTLQLAPIFIYSSRNIKPMTFLWVYLNKYIRFLPIYIFGILFQIYVAPFLGNGPIFYTMDSFVDNCTKNWWANILYVSNIFGYTINQCLRWLWFLDVYFQFYLVLPFLLWLYARSRRWFMITMGIIFIISTFVQMFLVQYYSLNPAMNVSLLPSVPDTNDTYYTKPYCRDAGFIIGVILALSYLSYTHKGVYKYWLFDRCTNFLLNNRYPLYIIGFIFMFMVIFLIYPINQWPDTFTQPFRTIYFGLERPFFISGLSFILYPCLFGKGKIVRNILSMGIFAPLSRLTFGVNMLNMFVLFFFAKVAYNGEYYDKNKIVYNVFGTIFMAYLGAFFLVLVIERPFRVLFRAAFKFPQLDKTLKTDIDESINISAVVRDEVVENEEESEDKLLLNN